MLTDAGRIATDTVVCAAGAWSRAVGEMAGVDLPVVPLRRQILTTEPMPGLDPATPFTIDFATSLYFHLEGPGLLLGMSDPDERPASSSAAPTPGCPGSARRSSAGCRRWPTSASPPAGPGSTR